MGFPCLSNILSMDPPPTSPPPSTIVPNLSTGMSLDRVRGMFTAHAIGDALGFPHEFKCNANTPYTGWLQHHPFHTSRFQGRKDYKIGQVSDDTEMTLALLRTIIKDGGYNTVNVALAYMAWANTNPPIGVNTRERFKGVKTFAGFDNRRKKFTSEKPISEQSQSNGALMRCTPLALLNDDLSIIEDVKLSHNHPVVIDCSIVYVTGLRLALRGRSAQEIFLAMKARVSTMELMSVFLEVEMNQHRNVTTNKSKGWCLHAMWFTLVSMFFSDFDEAMKWIITSQPGSDTDTNAAIAGGMLGAILGFEKICGTQMGYYNVSVMLNLDCTLEPSPRPAMYSWTGFWDLTEKACLLANRTV